ncbi:MAG: hypothetical protein HKO66_14930, partial [Saprospiraceae bacterium]|nr:hypothetical protein [Bacteroidia bacterium]NNL93533.1 hypothetical protein [Saprospiraceae bacterium]
VPRDAEDYVHRIGRTARAAASGVAITLINPDDMYHFSGIENLIEKEIFKINVPAELGESPKWEVNKRRSNNRGRPKSKPRKHSGNKRR